jgi:hypothetical protein
MKKILTVIICLSNILCYAENIMTTPEGKKLKINTDGTWEEIKEDPKEKQEILTTKDGEKVILNQDGTWKKIIEKQGDKQHFSSSRYNSEFFCGGLGIGVLFFGLIQYENYKNDADSAKSKADENFNMAQNNRSEYNYYINEYNKGIAEYNSLSQKANQNIWWILIGGVFATMGFIRAGIENDKPRLPTKSSSLKLYYAFTPQCGVFGIHKTF